MNKRKNDNELKNFVWKRKSDYDYLLLVEVQCRNPFSFKNQKKVWIDIAKALQEGPLKMKVTNRSCRERISELLKKFRKEERESTQASGVSEDDMTELKKLLTSVAAMEQTKPDKQVESLYLKNDKRAAVATRTAALREVDVIDSSDDERRVNNFDGYESDDNRHFLFGRDMTLQEHYDLMMAAEESTSEASTTEPLTAEPLTAEASTFVPSMPQSSTAELSMSEASTSRQSMPQSSTAELSMSEASTSGQSTPEAEQSTSSSAKQSSSAAKQAISSHKAKTSKSLHKGKPATASNSRIGNPKKDLVNYLENKSMRELDLRKDELRIREQELQNKTEELKIARMKAEAEVEERKKLNDLLVKLITKNQ